jgi:hypothetical protein
MIRYNVRSRICDNQLISGSAFLPWISTELVPQRLTIRTACLAWPLEEMRKTAGKLQSERRFTRNNDHTHILELIQIIMVTVNVFRPARRQWEYSSERRFTCYNNQIHILELIQVIVVTVKASSLLYLLFSLLPWGVKQLFACFMYLQTVPEPFCCREAVTKILHGQDMDKV